jgi:ribulose-5-phosphate 4-epimerase/fuculose-1-phosphate aldolase
VNGASTVRFASYSPPSFDTIDHERQHRKERLVAAFRLFARFGFDEGAAGHASVRDPELLDHFWINPPAVYFGHLTTADLLLISPTGETVQGDRLVDEIQFSFHAPILAARADVVSVVHTHCEHARAWSALLRLLDPITQDACAFYGDHSILPDYSGLIDGLDEGRRIAAALAGNKAVFLSNHGVVTVGATIDEAAYWMIAIERSCKVQILAESVGQPRRIDHETASKMASELGSPTIGWLNFQPLYDQIVRQQPDLLG